MYHHLKFSGHTLMQTMSFRWFPLQKCKLCHGRKWKEYVDALSGMMLPFFIIISQLISKYSCVHWNYGTTNGHMCKVSQQLSEELNVFLGKPVN